jgi:Putative transposase DNA-binding domain
MDTSLRLCGWGRDETVSDAADGRDVGGIAGIVAQGLAQGADVDVNHAVVAVVVVPPDGLKELAAGEDLAGVPGEGQEEVKVQGGQGGWAGRGGDLAAAWRMLGYKTTWHGGQLIIASRWFPSSRTCSGCGTVKAKLGLSERTYICTSCGFTLDRDINAAANLLKLAASGAEGQNASRGTVRPGHPGTPR